MVPHPHQASADLPGTVSGRLQGDNVTDLQPVGASSMVAVGKNKPVHELTTDEVKIIVKKLVIGSKNFIMF